MIFVCLFFGFIFVNSNRTCNFFTHINCMYFMIFIVTIIWYMYLVLLSKKAYLLWEHTEVKVNEYIRALYMLVTCLLKWACTVVPVTCPYTPLISQFKKPVGKFLFWFLHFENNNPTPQSFIADWSQLSGYNHVCYCCFEFSNQDLYHATSHYMYTSVVSLTLTLHYFQVM